MSQITVTDIIAVVFDFDDTLVPDSTSKLLRAHSIKPEEFWPQANDLLKKGYDQPCAYLKLLLDLVGEGKPFGKLTNKALEAFGATLDDDFFPGLPDFFDDLSTQVQTKFKNIEVEFYIVSGGLQAVMQGSRILQKYFAGIHACQLGENLETGVVQHIKRSVTFTEKTRYLFEINKGIKQSQSDMNPFLVNEDIAPEKRRIPFKNIVYVGDGMTDIPCFSTVKHFGGQAFGVFDPSNPEKTKQAMQKFLVPRRVIGMYRPRFGPADELGAFMRQWAFSRAADIQLEREMELKASGQR
jgi:haloacid dehalogenase-like hydrolase